MSTSEAREGEGRGEDRTEQPTPDPDDPRKPDGPTDLTKRSWFYVLRKTMHEFTEDQCTDLAAALTYYAVLSIFPACWRWSRCSACSARPTSRSRRSMDTLEPLVSETDARDDRTRPGADRQLGLRGPGAGPRRRCWRCGRRRGTSARSAGR